MTRRDPNFVAKYAVIRALVAYRQDIGMSLVQLAREMGYDYKHANKRVADIETKGYDIRMSVLFKYAAALGLEFKLQVREIVQIDELPDRNGKKTNPFKHERRIQLEPGTLIGRFRTIGLPAEESLEFWENEAT